MANNWINGVNERIARTAFERAVATQVPDFGTFFLARWLDLEIAYPDERCIIEFPIRDFLFNPQGSLHGGIIATVMDISMGHLLRHHYGRAGLTLDINLQYLRPLRQGKARCEASFTQHGRTIAFLQSKLFDEERRLAVSASSTWKIPEPDAHRE